MIRQIKQAWKSLTSGDDTAYPQGQSGYKEKTTNFTRLSPYGLFGNAPKDSTVLLFSVDGQESLKYGLESDMLKRFKNLKEGECGLYNTITKSLVFLKESGDILVETSANVEIIAKNVTITATDIKLSGNIELDGPVSGTSGTEINAVNDIKKGTIVFGTHVHDGVQAGTDDSGGPK